MVAHSLGKGEVMGLIPIFSTMQSALGEMDIMLVFETSGGGSIPSGPAIQVDHTTGEGFVI